MANSMYDIGHTKENVDAWLRDRPIRDQITSGVFPLKIFQGRQRKHIQGTNEYRQYVINLNKQGKFGPSRLTITIDDAQSLVDRYRGTGILVRGKNGQWMNQELITTHPEKIGVAVNDRNGTEADTMTFKIHYSKDGTHIVPDYPSKKGAKARK